MAEYFADLQENQYTADIQSDHYDVDVGETIQIVDGRFQDLTVTPTNELQIIEPDVGYTAFSRAIINPIPQNYGLITWNGSTLTVS